MFNQKVRKLNSVVQNFTSSIKDQCITETPRVILFIDDMNVLNRRRPSICVLISKSLTFRYNAFFSTDIVFFYIFVCLKMLLTAVT